MEICGAVLHGRLDHRRMIICTRVKGHPLSPAPTGKSCWKQRIGLVTRNDTHRQTSVIGHMGWLWW